MKEKHKRVLGRALRQGLGVGAGIMLGGALIPRLAMPELYNGTWPPLALHCGMYFLAAWAVSSAVFYLLGLWAGRKSRRR